MNILDWLPRGLAERIEAAAIRRALAGKVLLDEWELETGKSSDDPTGQYLKAYSCYVWAYACIEVKMKFAAMVPLQLKQIKDFDDPESAELLPYNHPARVLWRGVNPINVPYQFVASMVCYLATEGEWYCRKDDGRGEGSVYRGPPGELWLLPPNRMSKKLNPDGTIRQFECQTQGGRKIHYDPKEIIWMYNFNPQDLYKGLSSLKPIERSIETDLHAQDTVKYGLKNQARPDIAWVTDGPKPANYGELVRMIQKRHGGPMNARKFGVFWGGLKPHEISKTPAEYGMGDIRDRDMIEAMVATGVPKGELGLDVANKSVIEEQARKFALRTMMPEMEMYLQFQNEFLWRDFGDNIVASWDWSKVPALKEDEKAKSEIVCAYVDRGIWTREEARAETGKPAEPDEGTLLVPMNLIPYESANVVSGPVEGGEKSRARRVEYTPDQINRLRMYERRVTTTEKHAATWIRQMFDAQEAAVLKAYRRSMRHLDDIVEASMLGETATPYMQRVIVSAIEQGIEHGAIPGIEFDFSLGTNQALKTWMETHTLEAVTWVNEKTTSMLEIAKVDIVKMASEGATTKQIEDRLRDVFDVSRQGRAKTIARTEVQHGIQETQKMEWAESGVVEGKTWLASFHPEGRHNHLHNVTIGLDDAWAADDGSALYAPGVGDSAGQTINCMCDMAPKVDLERKADAQCKRIFDKVCPPEQAGEGTKRWLKEQKISELIKGK